MRGDFYLRLLVLILLTFATVSAVATATLLPAYLSSIAKKGSAEAILELQKAEPVPTFDEETHKSVTDLNYKLQLVESAQKNRFSVSESVLQAVIGKKQRGIRITQIAYEVDTKKGTILRVRGTAASREALLQFRQAFERDAAFQGVALPISNFVKGENIEFNLTLVPKAPGQATQATQ